MPVTPAALLAVTTVGFQGDILRLVFDSGPLVKIVLLVLFGFSVLSWTIIFERYRSLKRAEADSLRFLRDLVAEKRLADLRERSTRYVHSPLVPIFAAGFKELTTGVADVVGRFRGSPGIPDEARDRVLDRVRRRVEEAAAAQAERLDRNLGLLATTGSVTPFIGLFGTVWGIMNAFIAIGNVKQATLAMVAPGIAEALIATAMGLFAAIPAVWAYNRYQTKVERLNVRYETFAEEFSSILQRQSHADE
jgi:biopolymer transport protein TolQ